MHFPPGGAFLKGRVPNGGFGSRGTSGVQLASLGCQLRAVATTRPGQRDFDLADALDDPEPTKKPSSDIYPKPKPPYRPQPGMPDDSGNIYPKPKPPYRPQPGMPDDSGSIYPKPRPPPRPQPGGSDSGGGYFGNTDRDDGRYPPRPKPPAGGGSYYPSNDGSGNTHGAPSVQVAGNRTADSNTRRGDNIRHTGGFLLGG
ncbi:glycoprotein Xg isoform X2 [Mirounga angustirostris]|uniref:glycoprotein Xg isoform X2 n=1 Tax=Mirounga angustirostris TaxID=9716 RepID=UPI00313E0C04